MRVMDIIEGTTVDGPGLRTSIYFAGCDHHCPGCHNPHTWDIQAGKEMSVDEIADFVLAAGLNVTFTGGDPLKQIDGGLLDLALRIRNAGKTVWCYTGYTMNQIKESDILRPILDAVDVIVDGPFIEAERDVTLPFRGSRNQNIHYLK